MRTVTRTEAAEMLLRALYEGTASDGPWVHHNGVAWAMEELACDDSLDPQAPYLVALLTQADDRARRHTIETLHVVERAAQCLLDLLEERARHEEVEDLSDPNVQFKGVTAE